MTTAVAAGKPSMLRRTAAAVALAALVAALVYLAVSAISRWYVLLASVVSLGVAVIAAWYILSRRGAARAVAGVVAALALACIRRGGDREREPNRARGRARARRGVGRCGELRPEPRSRPARRARAECAASRSSSVRRRRTPVLLMNLKSGGGKAERFRLVDLCRQRGIEPVVLHPGDDLRQLAQDAVARGADLLGMAGGDGSQALVASVASQHRIPFVVVPAGTRNHFALDLGLDRDDVRRRARRVPRTASTPRWTSAEVNGRVFVNNASMGVYAQDRPVGRLPGRQVADSGSHAARSARTGGDAARPALHAAVRRGSGDQMTSPTLRNRSRSDSPTASAPGTRAPDSHGRYEFFDGSAASTALFTALWRRCPRRGWIVHFVDCLISPISPSRGS